jgi:hypothetical protein
MDMDTPKVRAMTAANAGIAALTPRSPAVTPSGIAAAARALIAARAAQQGADKQQQHEANASADAAGASASVGAAAVDDGGAPKGLKRPESGKYKCVLDLSTPPGNAQQPQQQQMVLPVPAFQQLFGGKRLPGCSGAAGSAAAGTTAASPDVVKEAHTVEPETAAAAAAAASTEVPVAPLSAAGPPAASGKRCLVLNLGDGPTPTDFKGGVVTTAVEPPGQAVAAASCNSGAASMPAIKKTAVGFLPALHEIERMI